MPRKMSKPPYLGRLKLYWCKNDNLPILDQSICPICKKPTVKMNITPPGDIRPAFENDLRRIRNTVDAAYGEGLGLLLFPESYVFLINRTPGIDLSLEIYANGFLYGRFLYNILKQRFEFHPREIGARLLVYFAAQHKIPLKRIIDMYEDSVPFIKEGRSILAPGIKNIDPKLEKGDICIVCCGEEYLGLAIAHADSIEIYDMITNGYGKVAKNLRNQRATISMNEILSALQPQSWERVYAANSDHIFTIVQEAQNFIRHTIREYPSVPVAVAYSGGKDSLCTLFLVYEAIGSEFKIFFADTGLELPETVQNTYDVANILEMSDKVHIKYAHDKFWDLVDHFGPPGRDYRFCCHGLKAQRINEIIEELKPGGKVLSFLGQRRYESFSRAAEKRVYINSFIPQQIAATPIKNWNALEVWLYLLHYPHEVNGHTVQVPVNPMYYNEFERIGCYLCPASDLATLNILRDTHPSLMQKWDVWLEKYAKTRQLPIDWKTYGLWRFRHLDQQWKNYFQKHGIEYHSFGFDPSPQIHIDKEQPMAISGKFLHPINLNLLFNLVQVLPGTWSVQNATIFLQNRQIEFNLDESGDFLLKTELPKKHITRFLNHVLALILKTDSCANCGVCEDICPQNIIHIQSQRTHYIPVMEFSSNSPCIHCLKCITHCPLHQLIKEY